MPKARIIVPGTTGTRLKHVQGTFFLCSVHFIYVRQTSDIRQHKLLERQMNAYIQVSYALNTVKARYAHDTDVMTS